MKIRLYSFDPFRYHLVGKCTTSAWPVRDLNAAWGFFSESLHHLQKTTGLRIFAFVMMCNHYHLIASAESFHEVGAIASRLHSLLRSVFDLKESEFPQAHIDPIDHIQAYRNTYLYVYQNPVGAGLVTRAEGYAYSTLPYMLGRMPHSLGFRCQDDMNLVVDPRAVLERLNGYSAAPDQYRKI